MHYFQLLLDETKVTGIDDLIENSAPMAHCKVERTRFCWPFTMIYFHHFIILCINHSKMTVAHYWPTLQVLREKTVGKVVIETLDLDERKPRKPCDILDFSNGVTVISPSRCSLKRNRTEALVRLLNRQNESQYNATFNNCEHFVNDILYKAPARNQSESMVFIRNSCGALLNDLRGYIVRLLVMTFLIAASTAIGIWKSSISVSASALISSLQETDTDSCETTAIGNVIFQTVQNAIDVTVDDLIDRNFSISVDTRMSITSILSNSFVCIQANIGGTRSALIAFLMALTTHFLIDLIYTYTHDIYKLKFLLGKIDPFMMERQITVRLISACIKSVTLGGIGYLALFLSSPNPFLVFFVTYVGLGVLFRYFWLYIIGLYFDKYDVQFRIPSIVSTVQKNERPRLLSVIREVCTPFMIIGIWMGMFMYFFFRSVMQ